MQPLPTRAPRPLRRPANGFTLIELLVTIGILIFVLGMSIVGFSAMFKTVGVKSGARILRAAIDGAKIRAIQQRRHIRFEVQLVPGSTTHQWRVAADAGGNAQEWRLMPDFVKVDTNAGTSSHGADGRGGDYRPIGSDVGRTGTHTFPDGSTTPVTFTAVDAVSVTFAADGSVKRWAIYQRYIHSSKGEYFHQWDEDEDPPDMFALRLTNMRDTRGAEPLQRWLVIIPLTGGLQPYESEGETF